MSFCVLVNGATFNPTKLAGRFPNGLDDRENKCELSSIMEWIFEKCFFKIDKKYVMVFGHWNNYDLSLLSHGYSSLFLFNSIGSTCAFSSQYQRYVRILKVNETILTKRNFPVGTVLINVNLEHELALVLEVFYKSIYWNNEASVLVVNSNLTMGCFEASKSLRLAWGYNILKAYYLCPDLDGNSLIYTYNPFSSLATKSWNIIRVSNNETNNRWTLFSNKIIANETDVECYFDKTTNLDQYEVVVSVDVENPTLFTTGSSRVEEVLEVYPMIISMILSHIKANHTLLVYPIMTKYDKDKKPQGTFKAVVDGEVDIDARLKAITDQWKMQTNVVRGSHLLIVSRKVEVSGTKKFASALSMQIIVILVFAFGMFVAVSRLLLKLSWSNIYFEFIRTFTNAMQDHAFDKSTYFSERIVMIILILLTSGSSTYLLTLLSALNTVPDFEPIVETPRDLQHYPNMKLYAFASLPQELSDLVVSKIYQFDDLLDCVDKIKKNDHRVCICGFMMLGKCGIVETNLIHISRPVTTTRTSVSFQVRPDWPLLPKANWIIRRLFDSGIIMQYVKMCHKLPDPNDEDADPTSNDDLHFSFLLLLGGCFMELNNAAAALSWWLRLRQEPRMTPPVADEGTETKYYFGNQQEAAAAGRMGRNLDPIGGGNLVRRNLDSIGGGNLLRSVQQTPSRFARSMTVNAENHRLKSQRGNRRGSKSIETSGFNHAAGFGGQRSRLADEGFSESVIYPAELKRLNGNPEKRHFDEIDRNDFNTFKRNIDEIDRTAFNAFKRNLDEIDRTGFNAFKRNFDEIDRAGFGGFADKRNIDEIDRAGFGGFNRKRNFDEIDRSGVPGFAKRSAPRSSSPNNSKLRR
ncbi:hypothetical protein TKK_0012729 [Trichogramma kaykai]